MSKIERMDEAHLTMVILEEAERTIQLKEKIIKDLTQRIFKLDEIITDLRTKLDKAYVYETHIGALELDDET